MELHNLKPAEGSIKKRKRIGRGTGSGRGGTSTRGHKGQKSRSGWSSKKNFEGGQMTMSGRLPKRGFTNINRVDYTGINLGRLIVISEKYNTDVLSFETLVSLGIVRKNDKVKILGNGELSKGLTVTAHACSASAKAAMRLASLKPPQCVISSWQISQPRLSKRSLKAVKCVSLSPVATGVVRAALMAAKPSKTNRRSIIPNTFLAGRFLTIE